MRNSGIYELLGVVVFFLVYMVTKNMYYATGLSILFNMLYLAVVWFKYKELDKKMFYSTLLLVILGSMTIIFHNNIFIQIKPTILYFATSIILVVFQVLDKNLVKKLLATQIDFDISNSNWNKYNLMWTIFFVVLGLINLYVAFNYSLDIWVKFKLFGTVGIMLVFIIIQGLLIAKAKKG